MYEATFLFDDVDLDMEIDTGARKSVISELTYRKQFFHMLLQKAKVKLRAYNGGHIP